MWRRVLLVLVAYSAIVVIGLALPLAITLGRERMQRFGENRLAAASYFADLAARENDSLNPELQQALGPETVDGLERETGLPRDDLLSQLSRLLPEVIDKLSPTGRLPRDEDLLPGPGDTVEQTKRRSA